MGLFQGLGMIIGGIQYLSPREANSIAQEDVVFIDLRPEYEILAKRIEVKTTVFIDWHEFEENYQILNPERNFIVFDEVGLHTKDIIRFLLDKGFKNIAGMAGGICDWERDGFPMDIDNDELMTGSCMCTLKPKKNFKK